MAKVALINSEFRQKSMEEKRREAWLKREEQLKQQKDIEESEREQISKQVTNEELMNKRMKSEYIPLASSDNSTYRATKKSAKRS